jgi:hypothetical protein
MTKPSGEHTTNTAAAITMSSWKTSGPVAADCSARVGLLPAPVLEAAG